MDTLESAIPAHLRCPRSQPTRTPDGYQPPYPASVARFKPETRQVVMAYLGLQYVEAADAGAEVDGARRWLAESLAGMRGPSHCEHARYVDEAGFTTRVSIAYWDDVATFDDWFDGSGKAWTDGSAIGGASLGRFIEVLKPSVERFETLFSSDVPEGVAGLATHLSGAIEEHAYWGGMRDRMPAAQADLLQPSGQPGVVTDGLRQRVAPQENLCLIRSGQDWTMAEADERRMYLDGVEPVLAAGMVFLRDQGRDIDCHANRYMTVLDDAGQPVEKTFGMSWWRSLVALERWAESHPTHVAIFGAALQHLGRLGPNARLKLYHEVTVATAAQQYFEYFNCHPQTGMLRAVQG